MYPVLFQFKGITVYTYGFFVACAGLVVWQLSRALAKRQGLDPATAGDMILVFFIGGIIGARLLFVAEHWRDYATHPENIVMIQEGGLSWFGSFAGGAFGAGCLTRHLRLPVLRWADFFAPLIALGHGIGRIGCYFNGCCAAGDQYHFIPSLQLLEAFFLFMLSAILLRINQLPVKRPDQKTLFFASRIGGDSVVAYCLGYGFLRFCIEFFRRDRTMLGAFSTAQWLSLALAGAGIILFFFTRFRCRRQCRP
jgi:phosphatidylglycerol---prolipoprotein diacylglyceryl transferase